MIFDLQQLLRLLPSAVAWAVAQEQQAAEVGQKLNNCGLELARSVGVKNPELIIIREAVQLPLPEEPVLRRAALATGLLGPDMAGLTLGYSIFVKQGQLTSQLISHECRHVYQYEAFGSIAEFLHVYLTQIVTYGYCDAPLEQDAMAHEVFFPQRMVIEGR